MLSFSDFMLFPRGK